MHAITAAQSTPITLKMRYPPDQASWIVGRAKGIDSAHATHLSFKCARLQPGVSSTIESEYGTIIRGLAHTLLQRDPNCGPNADLGSCANRYGGLGECSCSQFSRSRFPQMRKSYEQEVIDAVLSQVR